MRQLLTLLLVIATLPVRAGETPWQEIAPGVTARMISADIAQNGRTTVGLELRMPPGVNTYWRVPGETGIPTELSLEGSQGIAGYDIAWPHPERETAKGYVDLVYRGHLVLPVELSLSTSAVRLETQATLGICSDVCVPVSAEFELPLDFSAPDRRHALALRQATALAPLPWTEGEDPLGIPTLEAGGAALHLPVDPARIAPSSLIVDAGRKGPLFGVPEPAEGGKALRIPILGKLRTTGAEMPLTITFATGQGSFELYRSVALDGSTPGRQ